MRTKTNETDEEEADDRRRQERGHTYFGGDVGRHRAEKDAAETQNGGE